MPKFSFKRSTASYTPIPFSDNESSLRFDEELPTHIKGHKSVQTRFLLTVKSLYLISLGVLLGIIVGAVLLENQLLPLYQEAPTSTSSRANPKSCTSPSVRREWRTLSSTEKKEYISAVRCLARTPGEMSNGTLYDDFPWVHSQVAHITHNAAPFFSWHRYFIHIYENTLKTTCGYTGSLPYWDWTLDWQDMRSSPIWDNELGFGGDGVPDGEDSVGYGHCVDGPFADFMPLFHALEYKPHCLSRGFTSDFSGYTLRPDAMEPIFLETTYEKFLFGIETGPHDAVPNGVRGDFYQFTAPYDPVFYLHHAQLDRLWWLWQLRAPNTQLWDYGGKPSPKSTGVATLDDILPMGGLAPDIQVREIMETEGNILCYRYF